MIKKIFLAVIVAAIALPMSAQPKLTKDNIDEVLKAMTLEEKATLAVGTGWNNKVIVNGAAGATQAITRLGIPQTVLSDGPAGMRIDPTRKGDNKTYYCTGFPIGTLLACTWDPSAVSEVTAAIGNEVKEYGADVLLAPGMNLQRNPLNGRNFEYFSEDPLLSGKISAAYVNGIQSNGVGVSVKHFVCNNQETNRLGDDVIISQRALRELYLKGFEIAVKEAKPWTVMSSYNCLNGPFTQEDKELLTTLLRDEWGFGGIVMTDWTDPRNTAAQIQAGNDLMEPGNSVQTNEIIAKVKDGTLCEKDLDICVKRILEFIVKTPRFNGYHYSDKPDLKAHAQIAKKVASQGIVLLKNHDALPLKTSIKVALFGVTSLDFIAGGTGSGNVNKAYVVDLKEGLSNAGFIMDQKLTEYYDAYVPFARQEFKVNPPVGMSPILLSNPKIPEKRISRSAIDGCVADNDVAIVVFGRNAGEALDRTLDGDFNLSDAERQLLSDVCDAFHQASKKVIVVLNVGGVIETYSWKNLPDAILMAWQPGQEGGNAVADVLSGKVNPSGRLSMTFPISYMDHPSSKNFPYNVGSTIDSFGIRSGKDNVRNVDYTEYGEGLWVGYRYFTSANKEVSYPFGFGLSYTSFKFDKPIVKTEKEGGFTASVIVTNTGKVVGREVVELYVSAPDGGLVKPAKELKAFAKTKELAPGESQTLTMKVGSYELASFNTEKSEWETAAGNYVIRFSTDVDTDMCKVNLKIAKARVWLVHDIFRPSRPLQEMSIN